MLGNFKLIVAFVLVFFLPIVSLAENNSLKIGVLLCLSGECAETGQNSLNGIKLAAKKVNSSGGVLGKKIEIVVQDTREFSSGSNAITAYRNLRIDKDIKYFIGPTWTIGGLPLAPIVAKEKDILITSPSLGVADFNEAGNNIFNVWPHDSEFTKALAKLAISKDWKTAVIFSNQNPWEMTQGQAFAKEYKSLGGVVKLIIEPLASSTNLKVEALKAKHLNPDVVFFSNYTQVDIATRELKNCGYKGQKLLILLDKTRLESGRDSLEGAIVAEMPEPSMDFKREYKLEYGNSPGIASDTGYDVLMSYVYAMKKAQTTEVSKVISFYKDIEYNGVNRTINFDQFGVVVGKPEMKIVKKDVNTFKKVLYDFHEGI